MYYNVSSVSYNLENQVKQKSFLAFYDEIIKISIKLNKSNKFHWSIFPNSNINLFIFTEIISI